MEEIYVWKIFSKERKNLYSYSDNPRIRQKYNEGRNYPRLSGSSIFCFDSLEKANLYLEDNERNNHVIKKVKGIKSDHQPQVISSFVGLIYDFWKWVNSSDDLGMDNFYLMGTPEGTIFMDYIIIEENE